MIQVCSRCGTRWNVREQRRSWCPRCNGALLEPLMGAPGPQQTQLQWSPPRPPPPPRPSAPVSGQRLAPGYRWIAVRPGPPPPPRPRHRPLGPTPHYTAIPRWSLMDWVFPPAQQPKSPDRPTASAASVRKMLAVTKVALGIAALMQLLVYGLLIVNRSRLLHPVLAGAAMWLAILAGLVAIGTVIGSAVRLTRWLIARRSAAFAEQHLPESRSRRALWAGCMVPLANLAWAPVYVIELAGREGQLARLRKPILIWWLLWTAATGASVFATATSLAQDAQGIADNRLAMTAAYLLGVVAVTATGRLFEGFERRPVDRPAHHWVVVSEDLPDPVPAAAKPTTPAGALESDGREPAA